MTAQARQTSSPSAPPLSPSVAQDAAKLLCEHQRTIWKRTDLLLAALLEFEWALGIVLAQWRSPLTWNGAVSRTHPHMWAAIFLGGTITIGPVLLALLRPGRTLTRHTIAIGQMLMSGLLIHLGDGQIEMHFQIFGALAFLAFYRDWRVLVTASIVTATDHAFRGIYLPLSIYGVSYASPWLTAEHAAFVVFEDIFLIGSCIRGVREMRGIAENRALIEHSYHDIEKKVEERTSQLKSAQDELMKSARTAGMAEIATSVLHNVGNVLNSVNVSASLVAEKLRQSEVASLAKVSEMIAQHQPDLAAYITIDARGKLIPGFITELADCLSNEQQAMLGEVENLSKGIDHIKQIVAAQQSMAKKSNVESAVLPVSLIDTALKMQPPGFAQDIRIQRAFADVPPLMLDQHKVLQILINLISNARQAVVAGSAQQPEIRLSLATDRSATGTLLRFKIADNGMGIAPENLSRIFSHGFTTKKEGHGFGLHGAANAAREMGGSLRAASDGAGKGAVFTLDLPFVPVGEESKCSG
jgi:signal transduction histidine kinase